MYHSDPTAIWAVWKYLEFYGYRLVEFYKLEIGSESWHEQFTRLGVLFSQLELAFPEETLFNEKVAGHLIDLYIAYAVRSM